MHPRVKMIFEDHERWLKDGGNMAIGGVQQANLAEVMNKHLFQQAAAVQARLTAGARRIGKLAELAMIIEASVDGDEEDPVREPGQPDQVKGPEAGGVG